VQRAYGQEPQVALTVPLLEGTDGFEKMSKSLNNYIGLTEPPETMFMKAMRVPDANLLKYVTLCTDLPLAPLTAELEADPVGAHRTFARALVTLYHGAALVAAAEARYDEVARGGTPQDLRELLLGPEQAPGGRIEAAALAVHVGFAASKGAARRLIDNRGLRIDGVQLDDRGATLDLGAKPSFVFQSGKNAFVRVVWRPD
jgi:tyrosyl-tRNA synthetase